MNMDTSNNKASMKVPPSSYHRYSSPVKSNGHQKHNMTVNVESSESSERPNSRRRRRTSVEATEDLKHSASIPYDYNCNRITQKKSQEDLNESELSPVSQYGYNDYNDDNDDCGHSTDSVHGMAIRQKTMTKNQSEAKLKAGLSMVRDYKSRGNKIEMLKDQIGNNNRNFKPKKVPRRSSISSSYSYNSTSSAFSGSTGSYRDPPSRSRSGELSSSGWSNDGFVENQNYGTSLDQTLNQLSITNAVENDALRTSNNVAQPERQHEGSEQIMVESLVWFSFHTPRAVLEDLITHELTVWRQQDLTTHLGEASNCLVENGGLPGNKAAMATFNALKSRDDDSCTDEDDGNDSDLSSLSDEGVSKTGATLGDARDRFESMVRLQGASNQNVMTLPKSVERESALLFVDFSGFTKLSTMLDVESLSKVINSYFDMIVSEVISHGGDILKFAGDAFFAEWKVVDDEDKVGKGSNPLADLNEELASINEFTWDGDDVPKISTCVLSAAKCGADIVKKYSDYHVTGFSSEAMLNVHCGIGVGHLVGLHVGDYKEGQEEEEEAVALRREFLILGEPIDQVSKAADMATDGELMASPEAMLSLSHCCNMPKELSSCTKPVCIAARDETFLKFDSLAPFLNAADDLPASQPYESLRKHCKALSYSAIQRLHVQMALYVHPVIRSDELALSAAIQAGKKYTETLESRHRAEAELRSVYTIFINAILSPRVTGKKAIDDELYKKLNMVMHVTSRELDRYSGHLRQFIVDDKGVVLIATFGLRGSTFPNMVANNGLPATFAIHRALKSELNIENRIGATFGKVYCGVVGGVRRHEFAVMGAPVNLAARLMSHKVNKGILVDESVRVQADARFAFRSLPPVRAKGYEKPVPILEPLHAVATSKKKKPSFPFIGRTDERRAITSISAAILEEPVKQSSSMVFLMGESGMGKSALALAAIEEIRESSEEGTTVIQARSTSTETEQRIPLSSYRKIFLSICETDNARFLSDDVDKWSDVSSKVSIGGPASNLMRPPAAEQKNRVSLDQTDGEFRQILTRSVRGDRSSKKTLQGIVHTEYGDNLSARRLRRHSAKEISADLSMQSTKKNTPIHQKENSRSLRASFSHSLHGMGDLRGSRHSMKGSLSHSLHLSSYLELNQFTMMRSMSTRSITASASGRCGRTIGKVDRGIGKFDDGSVASGNTGTHGQGAPVPYFEKLCWVCEELGYPHEYADIVGSQLLGLDGANPAVMHVDGHVPTMDELIEFLALAFICITDYADLTVIFIDDFQWVDSFSWKIFRVLCKRGEKLLLICAMRSHDKQAMRRLSATGAKQDHLQMTEISLGPLDVSEIRDLMSKVLEYDQNAIPDPLCSDIFQTTGGLPVYVVQLLENIKRKKTVELNEEGLLRWTAEGLEDKRMMALNKTDAVMEETFLSRFDALDIRVRKVLQTSAVLGLNFALSDVILVHPEMEEIHIENALDSAVDEMILMEQVDADDETISLCSGSNGITERDELTETVQTTENSHGLRSDCLKERYFQFNHAMWRKNVLATMLKERKIELHRRIAESMENDPTFVLEQSDVSRLLTLFDHWKSCGDFCKSTPLALTVGARLEEWDLSAQSLEIYEDALEMAFDSVQSMETGSGRDDEWLEVSSQPKVVDLILRLHIRIGLCHQQLGDEDESISMFEDAYNIIKTLSKIPNSSKPLIMPIISSLCLLKLDQEAHDTIEKNAQEKLTTKFVAEAKNNGSPVHIGRALSMQAMFFGKIGRFSSALDNIHEIESVYNFERDSFGMVREYGREFVLECYSESVQWCYLSEKHEEAEKQADLIIEKYLSVLDPADLDGMMHIILPIIQVFKLIGRAKDAARLLKKYVVKPFNDQLADTDIWAPLFNPLTFLLDVIIMEDDDKLDEEVIERMERWVFDDTNSEYEVDLEQFAHCLMGELCWRLANFREDDDLVGISLLDKAEALLTPIAQCPYSETFLRHTAQALLKAL